MNALLKIEYFALFVLSLFLFHQTQYVWWMYLMLFLLPDIGMIGYLHSTKVGAATYNATHFLGTAVSCLVFGYVFSIPLLYLAGIILLGHLAFDRILGFGLKYKDAFKHTHLSNL